ncbi:uncharacterized protein LOC116248666 [Nymphaea colorata]|nr:uncharacterized protein LOC116248666 [Nymphaea colorata]
MTTMAVASRTEGSDSYYSGCRKTNNCLCEMCIESINATLDLMPSNQHRSNLASVTPTSKISSLRSVSPLGFGTRHYEPPSPTSKSCEAVESSVTSTTTSEPTAHPTEEGRKKKGKFGSTGLAFKGVVAACCFFLMADLAYVYLSGVLLRTAFSPEVVHGVAAEASHLQNVRDQVHFIQKKLKTIRSRNVEDCNSMDSAWEIKKDGLLLHSKCILYKSMGEEISIWGWPLQTEGLLVSGLHRRSITILSGQLVEWKNGKMECTIRRRNSSWTEVELSAKAVQLDPMTWMLEHRHLAFGRDLRLFPVVIKVCKTSGRRIFESMKGRLLVPLLIQEPTATLMQDEDYKAPT